MAIAIEELRSLGAYVNGAVESFKQAVLSADDSAISDAKATLLQEVEKLYNAVRAVKSPSEDVGAELDKLLRSANLLNYGVQEYIGAGERSKGSGGADFDQKGTRVTNGVKKILDSADAVLSAEA
eukprot:TRINITY_DN3624_c0_g2_i1.p1 TRINITY_DN3624_c0_g2~~TRINITY_DN3624_c0_g2_i1.p1  ORF type:complete len:125 (+),score=31.97 TRINITY_DN3624_c0_g2_i1:274-648(+)